MDPKMALNGGQPQRSQPAGALLKALASKMVPRWPREAQDSFLGAFLGLQNLSWTALDPRKPSKTVCFFKVCANACFRYFAPLDGPLGPICRSGPKMGPQVDPERTQDGEPRARSQADGVILEALGLNMPPRWLKMALSSPHAEGKAETGSVYRGCMLCPVLCCFEFLWGHRGLL